MALPIIIGGGMAAYRAYKAYKLYKRIQQAKKLKEAADKARRLKKLKEAAKKNKKDKKCPTGKCKKKKKKEDKRYKRPKHYRKGMRDKVWEDAKGADGKVRDPLTGKEIKPGDKWDMGHKPGHEFRKMQSEAKRLNLSRKQFLDKYMNSDHFRPELPSSNRGHALEDMTDKFLGF